VVEPGIYPGMPMADYLAIDALSTTPVRALIDECPRMGWWRSRLNPNRPRETSKEMDVGSAAHSVLLEDSWACIVELDPAAYPSKTGSVPKGFTNDAIREARDAARAAGKYPVLLGGMQPIRDMVTVAQQFIGSLRTTEPAIWRAFEPDGGQSEVTMVWQDEAGMLCKLRTDRIANDYGVTVDYKTSGMSVEPDKFARSARSGMGYDFGAAWYCRGIKALTGVESAYLFLAQETEPPHLCSLNGIPPADMALASEQVAEGLRQWAQCLRTGQWPGYANRVCYAERPPWDRARWDERLIITGDGIEYGSQP
jgi:hypothetical protein